MMRAATPLAVASALAALLVACDAAPPRVEPKGQELRAELDRLTADYAACIDAGVAAADVSQDPAGSIAVEIVKACRPQRDVLKAKTLEFDQLGHPGRATNQSQAVADASVGVLEKELRENAVVDIVKRQNETR